MSDMICPYCLKEQALAPDNNACRFREARPSKKCTGCEKTFVFAPSTPPPHETSKADCLNGGKHWMLKVSGTSGVLLCAACWYTRSEEDTNDEAN